MRNLCLILVACLSMSGAKACFAGEALLGSRDLRALGYFKYWSLELDMDRGGFVRDSYRIDDSLYLVADKGDVHVVHAEIGLTRWVKNLTESVYRIFTPSHFESDEGTPLVVIATTPRVFVIDRYSGDEVKELTLGASIGGGVIADAMSVYFGSSDGHVYAMNWNDPRTHAAVFSWKTLAGGPVTSTPHLLNEGEDLVFASQTGGIFSCTSGQKILNWDFSAGGPIDSELAVDETSVYVASWDRSLSRLDQRSGALRWRVRFPEALHDAPVAAGNAVFQYCNKQGVTAIDAETGRVKWRQERAHTFVCRSDGQVILSDGAKLLKVASESGELLETITLPSHTWALPNTVDGTLYLVSRRGEILCAKREGHPYLTPDVVALAKRELHRAPVAEHEGDKATELKPRSRKRSGVIDWDDPLRSTSDVPPLAGNAESKSE